MAYRKTAITEAFEGDSNTRPQRLAALRARLEGLYTEHRTDEAVAVVLEVSVATLKRALVRLTDAGHAPRITRRRGARGADKTPRRRSRRGSDQPAGVSS